MELDDIQRLTLAQAVYKVVANAVSTKDPESLRSIVDDHALAEYAMSGVKSRDLILNDQKCGTYSIKFSKAKKVEEPVIEDARKFSSWVADNHELAETFAQRESAKFCAWLRDCTGEVPDGIEWHVDEIPSRATGTVLRVDEQKVADAMGSALPSAVAGLLGGAE